MSNFYKATLGQRKVEYNYTLCVITPTIGRQSLRATLESAALSDNDEWLVIGDGPQPEARAIVQELKEAHPYLHYFETDWASNNFGNTQRDIAMSVSDKEYFVFMDDDDIFAPEAIDRIRRDIDHKEPGPQLFKMQNWTGKIIWENRLITVGNVGTPMFVVPNEPKKLARWDATNGYESDCNFIKATVEKWLPKSVKWSGDIIALCKGN